MVRTASSASRRASEKFPVRVWTLDFRRCSRASLRSFVRGCLERAGLLPSRIIAGPLEEIPVGTGVQGAGHPDSPPASESLDRFHSGSLRKPRRRASFMRVERTVRCAGPAFPWNSCARLSNFGYLKWIHGAHRGIDHQDRYKENPPGPEACLPWTRFPNCRSTSSENPIRR